MKTTVISILIAALLIGGAIMLAGKSSNSSDNQAAAANNVTVVDGKQIIEIGAKGGYLPETSIASAEMSTVLRMTSNGTFDCSSSLTIPSIGYRGNLPPSGITDINVPAQKAGTKLLGICSMGMYSFTVNFN